MDSLVSQFVTGANLGIMDGIRYAPFVLGACLLLRIARFPDIGIEGSYLVGGCCAAAAAQMQWGLPVSIAFASVAGAVTGAVTATQHYVLRINALLAGIVTVMLSFSASFMILGSRSTLRTFDKIVVGGSMGGPSQASSIVTAAGVLVVLWIFFSTRWGLLAQFAGEAPSLLASLGRSHARSSYAMVSVGNGLVAMGAGMNALDAGQASVRLGNGMLLVAISSLALGEGVVAGMLVAADLCGRRVRRERVSRAGRWAQWGAASGAAPVLAAAAVGSVAYWVLWEVSTFVLGADKLSKAIVAGLTVVFLIAINLSPAAGRHLSKWRFVGF